MKFIIPVFFMVAISLLWLANEILPKGVNYSKLTNNINSKIVSKMKKNIICFLLDLVDI